MSEVISNNKNQTSHWAENFIEEGQNPALPPEKLAALPHDSGLLHTTGMAKYIDDLPTPANCLHGAFALAYEGVGKIKTIDISKARELKGVVKIYLASDIIGENNCGPVVHDDPILAENEIRFAGQAYAFVVAKTRHIARIAARLISIEIETREAITTVDEAMDAESFLHEPLIFNNGEYETASELAEHKLSGRMYIGGQDHLYLEGQVALAIPSEDSLHLFSSTQHPTEVQDLMANAMDWPAVRVSVEIRRMGGGFGGKESQASQIAVMAGIAAFDLGVAVKLRLDRDDDMIMTGKRHDFRADYEAAFDVNGKILGVKHIFAGRCGHSNDLSRSINDRTMFHADNGYFIPSYHFISHRCKTDTVSNTAFRGFGGPQGMVAIERVMDKIAAKLGKDPLDVRLENLYGKHGNHTPYGMEVTDNVLPELIEQIAQSSDYKKRRAEINAFNAIGGIIRKGIALTPIKFGISFTATHLNQAGSLVHIYKDGSVHLNHGGTEMGQGLYTKIRAVVMKELGIKKENIAITSTRTDKVPNTSPTAASSGADMNGMAAFEACKILKARLSAHFQEIFQVNDTPIFEGGVVKAGAHEISFEKLVRSAYMGRVQLSAAGYYATPDISWDAATGRGRPFYYFAYGASVSEVEINALTGENKVIRVDILHDVGNSLNPALDYGQIEGGFIQGMGWLTMEELVYSDKGLCLTHAPSTYKIPCMSDRPEMHISLFENNNREETIYRSKAVGEPPLMLPISVHSAMSHAVSSFSPKGEWPDLDTPATNEMILKAVRTEMGKSK